MLKLRVADVHKTFEKRRKIGEIKILIQIFDYLNVQGPIFHYWIHEKRDKVQKPHRNEMLRESLYEKKHPSYSPVNWVPHFAGMIFIYMRSPSLPQFTGINISLSNSDHFTSTKKCWRESCIIDFTSAKMEFASTIFKKLYFSKHSIKKCCKQITSIPKFVWPYK